jgi:hypothetical protein
MAGVLSLKTPSTGLVTLTPTNTATDKTITLPATTGTVVIQDGTSTATVVNLAYTGTLTGGTGVVNLGSGQVYKDASGNVGIGTTSPASNAGFGGLTLNGTSGSLFDLRVANTLTFRVGTTSTENLLQGISNVPMTFYTNNSEAMRIISGGNVGIGTSSPASKLEVTGDVQQTWAASMDRFVGSKFSTTYELGVHFLESSRETKLVSKAADSTGLISFYTGVTPTEKMRIDSSGNLLVGVINPLNDGKVTIRTPSSFTGYGFRSDSDTAAGTTWGHFYGTSSTNSVANIIIFGNGNIQNANNSYGALSDSKLKENIVDATPKLEKLNQVRVVNFNLIGDEQKQLGVIAQELEQIFPGMIDETIDRDAEGKDLGTTTKSVKYSVFVPMLIKAMQEQQALIQNLTTRLTALEAI